MRTNIVIDDKLMADAMAAGEFKTKREAVEAGLRLIKMRRVYDGLLALQGKLQWDDSDESWAQERRQQQVDVVESALAVQEPAAPYVTEPSGGQP